MPFLSNSKLKDNLNLLKAAVKKPKEVSTVFPTSRSLGARVLQHHDLAGAQIVVELGPGTGAITRPLLTRLRPETSYIGIEIVPDLVKYLETEFPTQRFVCGPAQNLSQLLDGKKADVVISSLPWTLMSETDQVGILDAVVNNLKVGGTFSTYVCVNAAWYPAAQRLKHLLDAKFKVVKKSPIVWTNIPPAFVYQCRL